MDADIDVTHRHIKSVFPHIRTDKSRSIFEAICDAIDVYEETSVYVLILVLGLHLLGVLRIKKSTSTSNVN